MMEAWLIPGAFAVRVFGLAAVSILSTALALEYLRRGRYPEMVLMAVLALTRAMVLFGIVIYEAQLISVIHQQSINGLSVNLVWPVELGILVYYLRGARNGR